MLYDGAIKFLGQSVPAMLASDYEKKGIFINKAVAIIVHLTGTLDFDMGGELAINLARSYNYLIKRLVKANYENDPAIINEVITHLRELRDAWNTVAAGPEEDKKSNPNPPSVNRLDLSLAA